MKIFQKTYYLIFLFFNLTITSSLADWNLFREYETVIVYGNSFPEFLNSPVNEIFLFSYDQNSHRWSQITFQIDERDDQWDYFITPNNVLNSNDEILFVAKEAGDQTPFYSWLEDENSRLFVRYELEITDPQLPESKKYIYVYRSSTLSADHNLPAYMNYLPATSGYSDTIKAMNYTIGHNDKGIPDCWQVPTSAGGSGINFLERQKARIKGKYRYSFFSYNYSLTENDLENDGSIHYKTGPIRTIRDVKYKVNFLGLMTVTVGTFKYQFFPNRVVAFGTNKSLGSDYGIKLIRQSFDLNANGIGMLFNDSTNHHIIINGVSEAVNKAIFPAPKINWYMISGSPGTLVMINEFEALINASASFYYYDNLNGGSNDGTDDTGDGKSYGDTGILFSGSNIQGKFSIPYVTYYLSANQAPDVGPIIADLYQNPLTSSCAAQPFIAPAQISVSLPDTSCRQGMTLALPLKIGNLKNELIYSFSFVIKFDSLILSFDSAEIENTLAESWATPIIDVGPDSISVILKGETALQDSGRLILLKMTAKGDEKQIGQLTIRSCQFNQGYPLASVFHGRINITSPPVVSLSLPDTIAATNSVIGVPVKIGDVTNMNVRACYLKIYYNKLILLADSVSVLGTKLQDWQLKVNYGIGWIEVNVASELALAGSGRILTIYFKVIGKAGQFSSLHFQPAILNYGIPGVAPSDGKIAVTTLPPIEIQVALPDTVVTPGSLLYLPISISSVTNLNIYSYRISLALDKAVIEFRDIEIDGSLTALWEKPLLSDYGNSVTITAFGRTALSGQGILVFLTFDVIGSQTSVSQIHISSMTVNASNVVISTRDGMVRVEGVVPVELAFFAAEPSQDGIILKWNTLSESNNYGFFLQRQAKFEPAWESIGFVKGWGTTAVLHNYQFMDKKVPAGKWYYRLKQQDIDGSITYSQVIEMEMPAISSLVLLQNYPNPFNSATTISYYLPEATEPVNIRIFNLNGSVVRNLVNKAKKQAGFCQIDWDGYDDSGERVSSGVYYYQMQVGDKKFSKKMVLIE